ncbi:sulfofructose kinase [Devosia enhydra]|uniref:Sulfofructose kinase n=1 Tax=Devosia enhydra TaxID=665118 RepID=A0A1K2I040_9HYPH|nr:PfkB family carbohydrate kinase [Devosia enhydra]SFZ85696.1 sulfofructose kinase [Devosia enhydra]
MADAILCVGALTHDSTYRLPELPAGARKYLAKARVEACAGMATSAAIAIARLGGRARLWASVGDDLTGESLLSALDAAGVERSDVRRVAGTASAAATILVDASGERIVVVHYPEAIVSPPAALPDLSGVAAVLVDARWPTAAALALDAARQAGLPAILDADTAPLSILKDLAGRASHILASRDGAAILSGETDPERALLRLADRYWAFVLVTDGARGCFWSPSPGGPVHHTPAPRVESIDTNAAGDVFHGAFALALAEGQPIMAATRFAVFAAALKCTRLGGAQGAPLRPELEAALALKDSPERISPS